MNFSRLLDSAFSLHLTLTLAHFLWQGLVIAALAAAASRCLRGASAQSRYLIHVAALLLMVACLPVTFAVVRGMASEPVSSAPADVIESPGGLVASPDGSFGVPAGPVTVPAGLPEPSPALGSTEDKSAASEAEPVTAAQAGGFGWRELTPYAAGAYFAGVLAMLVRLWFALQGGRRLRRRSQAIDDPGLLQIVRQQARLLGLRFVPVVAYCERVAVPVVVGVLRPMILLPLSLGTALTPDQLRAILTHELTHLRRYDHLANVLQRFVEAVLFFHPAAWYVGWRINVERENCCDDLVVATGEHRCTYAESLVRAAELSLSAQTSARPRPRAHAALGASDGSRSRLGRRILRLIDGHSHEKLRLRRTWPMVFVLIATVLIPTFALMTVNAEPAGKHEAADAAATQPGPATQAGDPEVTVEQTESRCGYAGQVIDAETGKPVEKFDMRIGWTQEPVADAKDISWYSMIRGAARPGGKFSVRQTVQKSQKQYIYFLILAEGYLPQLVSDKPLSGPFRHTGVVVRLKRGKSIIGRVLDHAGKPVVGANVFLVSRQRRLELVDGKPEHFTGSSGVTDANGRFKLPGGGEATTHVVVSCKSLHAWLTKIPKAGEEFTIRLPAPATIVLKYDISGAAAAGVFRVALRTWEMPEWKGLSSEIRLAPTINQKGTVTLSNVTPGVYSVDRRVETRVGNSGYGRLCDGQRIEVTSGQTERINFVRETGVPIVGEIPGLAANAFPGASILIEELTAPSGPGKEVEPALLDTVTCGPDGKFKTSRIPPGRYHVYAEAYAPVTPEQASSTGWNAPAFVGSAEVTVPATGEPARVRLLMKPWQHPRIPAKAPVAPATAAARERCWRDMGTGDYAKASGGAAALGVGGDKAAKFISDKLLIAPADPARIKQLIAQLDSPQYDPRQKAHADLTALDMAALPGLRAAVKGDLSAEARTRIKTLLAREPGMLMRLERAIAILARLDRPRCLQVLRALAKRAPAAPETRLAEELLGRASVTMTDARIAELIARLGGRDYADRKRASEALVKIGLPAVAALQKAAADDDAERAARAAAALAEIENQGRIAIYLVARPLDVAEAVKTPLDKLLLQGKPIFTDDDIVGYDWDKHILQLTKEKMRRLAMISQTSIRQAPFVVTCGNRRRYLGAFWHNRASVLPDVPLIYLEPDQGARVGSDAVRIEPPPAPGAKDTRGDEGVRTGLKLLGKLAKATGADADVDADAPWGAAVGGLQCRLRILTPTVEPHRASFTKDHRAFVVYELRNVSDKPIRLIPWHTPMTRMFATDFHVVRADGEKALYVGKHGSPAPATPESFLAIGPGQTLTHRAGLSYDFRTPGVYKVSTSKRAYKRELEWFYRKQADKIENNPDRVWTGTLTSNTVTLTVEAPGDKATPPAGGKKRLIFHGLDLTDAPRTTKSAELPDLWEEVPPGSKSYEICRNVKAIRSASTGAAYGVVYDIRGKNIFYIQCDQAGSSTMTFYGPFKGDPAKRLKLPKTPATVPARGGRLEFRIVPNGMGSSRSPIIPSYVGRTTQSFAARARKDLTDKGPCAVAYGDSGMKLRWVEMVHEIPRAGLVVPVIGKHKGTTYVLLCDGDPYVMLPAAGGEGAWGLADVHAAKDAQGRPAVMVTFDTRGARLFERLTKANKGNALAVIVDGKVLSSPALRTTVATSAMIVGDFTDQQVRDLVATLKAGMQRRVDLKASLDRRLESHTPSAGSRLATQPADSAWDSGSPELWLDVRNRG